MGQKSPNKLGSFARLVSWTVFIIGVVFWICFLIRNLSPEVWENDVRKRVDAVTRNARSNEIQTNVRAIFGDDIDGVCVVSPSHSAATELLDNAHGFDAAAKRISNRDQPGYYAFNEARNYLYLYVLRGVHADRHTLTTYDGQPGDGRLWSGESPVSACYPASAPLTIVAAKASGAFEFPVESER